MGGRAAREVEFAMQLNVTQQGNLSSTDIKIDRLLAIPLIMGSIAALSCRLVYSSLCLATSAECFN